MSAYFTRQAYDDCNIKEELNISIRPSMYRLETPNENDKRCFPLNGLRNTRSMTSSQLNAQYAPVVEIENSLYNLDIPLSRCITGRTLVDRDEKINKLYNSIPKVEPTSCEANSGFIYTRLEPQKRTAEMPYNRYDYPLIDPKEWVFYGNEDTKGNNRDGRSTRYDSDIKLDAMNKRMRETAMKGTNQVVPHNADVVYLLN